MRHAGRWLVGAAAVVFVALLPSSVVIVDDTDFTAQQESEEFDPSAYVDGIWDSELVPTVEENAQDLAAVLGAMEVDAGGNGETEQLTAVAEQFGTITVGEAHVYLVRGTARVTSMDPMGLLLVELDGYEGPIQVGIYAGSRIPSDETALRDGVGFIEFGDFREQTEYGKVAGEINQRVISDVVAPLVDLSLEGRQIDFAGAFAIRTFNLVSIDLRTVSIVPVRIDVEA